MLRWIGGGSSSGGHEKVGGGSTGHSSRDLTKPLITRVGDTVDPEVAEYQKNGTRCGMNTALVMGALAFIMVFVLMGVGLWRLQVVQEDLQSLDARLTTAEELLVEHTDQIAFLNTTLVITIGRVTQNTARINTLNATEISQGLRITSLENRTTLLENRLTLDEIKLLGVMNNVTALQTTMAVVLANISALQVEVAFLLRNASDHEMRIDVLEAKANAQASFLANIATWLQQNLTIIDSRLNTLNVTYTVTGNGTAHVVSGPALTSNVTWQTRHYQDVGLDFEYLWISTTNWNPTQIRVAPGGPFSFQITNFTSNDPYGVVPSPSLSLDRPLGPFQQSKFLLQSFLAHPQVLSAAWDNVNAALNFRSNLQLFDAVTIIEPLTFITGFL
jgi:uncharacterized coiled-coil protein SlyX